MYNKNVMDNLLLLTDVYKLGHMEQYPKDTHYVYSYMEARKRDENMVFYGLQYFIKKYLMNPITSEDVEEVIKYRRSILGNVPDDIINKYNGLVKLGYLPLKIHAVPEGTILPTQNVLITIESTHPEFYWLVGYVESLLLKVWNTCTVASKSLKYYDLVRSYGEKTCDDLSHLPFCIHDFGHRGCSSEETAMLSGSAHLIAFKGSDTVSAVALIDKFYGCEWPIGLSVPATEHSVMCCHGELSELETFRYLMRLYPTGIISIVSDSFDYFRVLSKYLPQLREEIVTRDGKIVVRPDSGDPYKVILGDPEATDSAERKGSLELLGETFGYTINTKGYKVLNPKIGLIYGDGMYFERFSGILEGMEKAGWATSNLVIGIGGLLLQQNSRDDLGFALKATKALVGDAYINVIKTPKTDPGKKSKTGWMKLVKSETGSYETVDKVLHEDSKCSLLRAVFEDGVLYHQQTFDEIRQRFLTSYEDLK